MIAACPHCQSGFYISYEMAGAGGYIAYVSGYRRGGGRMRRSS